MTKNAVVIAYVNRTGELLGCHINCKSWGVRYVLGSYNHYIEDNEGCHIYIPCNLLHLNTPEAIETAENDKQHWWQKFYKDIPKLREALIKEGIIDE